MQYICKVTKSPQCSYIASCMNDKVRTSLTKKFSSHTLMERLKNLIDLSGNRTHDPRIRQYFIFHYATHCRQWKLIRTVHKIFQMKMDGVNGIIGNHAYAMTGAARIPYKGRSIRMIRMRNPWGEGKTGSQRAKVLFPGYLPSPYWSPYWICTQHPTCQWSHTSKCCLILRAIPAIHEINALREVLWQRVGKFLLKSTIALTCPRNVLTFD